MISGQPVDDKEDVLCRAAAEKDPHGTIPAPWPIHIMALLVVVLLPQLFDRKSHKCP